MLSDGADLMQAGNALQALTATIGKAFVNTGL